MYDCNLCTLLHTFPRTICPPTCARRHFNCFDGELQSSCGTLNHYQDLPNVLVCFMKPHKVVLSQATTLWHHTLLCAMPRAAPEVHLVLKSRSTRTEAFAYFSKRRKTSFAEICELTDLGQGPALLNKGILNNFRRSHKPGHGDLSQVASIYLQLLAWRADVPLLPLLQCP